MEIFREINGLYGNISKENVKRADKYIVLTGNDDIDYYSILALEGVRVNVQNNIPNDISKYSLPECFKTSLVSTFNARALQNFFQLRTDKKALLEIQLLAKAMFDCLPEEHKPLFEEFIK